MKPKHLLMLLCTLVAILSCTKMDEGVYSFNSEGGLYIIDVEIDGSSMLLSSDTEVSQEAVFRESLGNPEDSDWLVELNGIRAHYFPASSALCVTAKDNTTGSRLRIKLTAIKDGKRDIIAEFRQD